MAIGSSYGEDELRDIKDAAEKVAERMNMRFVLNPDKVREFTIASTLEEMDSQESNVNNPVTGNVLNT